MWKVVGSSAKYATEEAALKAAGIHQAVMKEAPVEKTTWSPLEKLRKASLGCKECECDPCECEEEWKSADET